MTITLITGASKGLGREVARRLLEIGHTVLIGARDAECGQRSADELGGVFLWIEATGKNLTTIYITHGHGDHFFGLNSILGAFPNAKKLWTAAQSVIEQGQGASS